METIGCFGGGVLERRPALGGRYEDRAGSDAVLAVAGAAWAVDCGAREDWATHAAPEGGRAGCVEDALGELPEDDGVPVPETGEAAGVVQLIRVEDEGDDGGSRAGAPADAVGRPAAGSETPLGGSSERVPSRRQITQPPSGPTARPCLEQRPRFMRSQLRA